MKGDFTRGHRPDGKRGRRYTRGLLQQRRLLLDSDVNAMTDALHERLRDLASDLGCPKGSPDLGYLVTPGPLLAVFEELGDVVVEESNVTVYRDYSRKFLDRFPSVYIGADQGVDGSATIRVLRPADGDVRFWTRSEAATQADLAGGVALNAPAGDAFQPVDVNLAGPLDEIEISLDAGEEIWIALIEGVQAAGAAPAFAAQEGRFYLAGLPLTLEESGLYPEISFPLDPNELLDGPAPGALAADDLVAAYLEGWERHITAVEDRGLQEQALGGNIDTTTRGQATGQVKLVRLGAGPVDAETLKRAICRPVMATGTLEVTTPAAPPDPDPCALPVEDGYTGPDNRLYRFEVHRGGGLGDAIFTWSRDNGSELFAAIDAPADNVLVFPSNTPLAADDLVEVLNDAVDMGDRAHAEMLAPDQFQRPERASGSLAILEQAAGPPPANGVGFVLRQVSGAGDVNLEANVFGPFPGGAPIKVRRWHGRIETAAGTTEYELEHGIVIELNGMFSAGDYWQYEARVAGDNDNGPPVLTPHGPMRAFAPLALMRFDSEAEPLTLLEWLDDRFSPICELNADDLPFDGERIGEECDTVQEALECLFERETGGCCEWTLDEDGDDTTPRINQILADTQGEVVICFEPGVYPFLTSLHLEGRKVVLKGCPRAVLEASENAQPMIHLHGGARLDLEELIVFGPGPQMIEVFVEMDPDAGGLKAKAVGFLNGRDPIPSAQTAIRVAGLQPQPIDPDDPIPLESIQPDPREWPEVDVSDCVFVGGWIVSAPQLAALRMRQTVSYCLTGGISVRVAQSLEMRDVDIVVTAGLGPAANWTAQELLARGDELLDELPPIVEADPNVTESVAARFGLVIGGAIESCRFLASFGVVFTEARATRLAGNFYDVLDTGLLFATARSVLVSGEHIRAFGPDGRAGVGVMFRAQPITKGAPGGAGLSVSDSIVEGFETGIALAAALNLQIPHTLIGVRVSENQVTSTGTGVQVGPRNQGGYPGAITDVSVEDNEIRSTGTGVAANGRVQKSEPPYAEVRIGSNSILAARGIFALGAQFQIRDNRIRLTRGTETRLGVMAMDAARAVIEGNLVERFSEGQVDDASVAYFLVRGSDSRVSNNTSRSNQPLMGLRVDSHDRLRADGNDFGPGNNELTAVDDVVFRENRTMGLAAIRTTSSGQVTGNRFSSFQGDNFPGALQVRNAQGLWQVSANKADFGIDIQPAATQPFILTPVNFTLSEIHTSLEYTPYLGLRDMASRAETENFSNEVSRFTESRGGTSFEFAGDDRESILALNDENWVGAWTAGLANFVSGAVTEAVGAFGPDSFTAAALQLTERPYQALVEGNFCGTLQVGRSGLGVTPSEQTVVQVVANRAQFRLFVQRYRQRVVANNASDFYSGVGVGSQAAEIITPNLDT